LEQLRDITAVCKKHNISYNMMCGSLLGAVRHKGFIPWDDDVDLLMTREEFQKFREIYPKECDKRFELTYLDTWTPRVLNRDPEKAAAFTDFFILDPVPPEGFQRKWWFFKLHTLQGMLKKNVDWSRFNWKNKILIFGTHVLGLPFSVKTKTRWYEQVSRQEKTGNDLCMSNGAFELMMHIWHPDQFAEKIVVPFEGIDVLIPAKMGRGIDHPLRCGLHDPAPESERVAKHFRRRRRRTYRTVPYRPSVRRRRYVRYVRYVTLRYVTLVRLRYVTYGYVSFVYVTLRTVRFVPFDGTYRTYVRTVTVPLYVRTYRYR